jgi:DNA modification methylase
MIINADCLEWLDEQPDQSIDHVITDFVYETSFPFLGLVRVCRGAIITFCSDLDYPFEPTERAYWIKTPSTKNYSKHLGRFIEHIFIYRGEYDVFNSGLHWSQYTGVYTDLVEEPSGHQWQKPLSLMERLVKIYTKPGDLVLDPFCGSGQTLKACKNLGRRFIGIDIDKKWTDYCREQYETK